MKRFFSLTFLCLVLTMTQAQDYQLFISNRAYEYEFSFGGQNHFARFRSVPPTVTANDSIFHNYPCGNDDNLFGPPANGQEYFSDTSWSGYQIVVSPNGDNLLLNRFSDTLLFKTFAQPGDNWTFYQFTNGDYFLASLDSVKLDSVMGLTDSIKYISISRFDQIGNPVFDSLNQFTFAISKTYGLAKTVNIKHFPLSTTVYQLKGIESLAGEQRMTPGTIFNYDPGDVFHYTYFERTSLDLYTTKLEKRRVLSRTVQSNSIDYTIEDSLYVSIYNSATTTTSDTMIVDTILETVNTGLYDFDSLCSKEPYFASMFSITPYNYMTSWHRGVNDRRAIYTVPCLESFGVTPPFNIMRSIAGCTSSGYAFPNSENVFVEGLGLFHEDSSLDSASSVYSSEKNLVYYQKGSETYGTPLAFPLINNIRTPETDNITLYPNPARDIITISGLAGTEELTLYTPLFHKTSISTRATEKKIQLQVSTLPPGMYLLSISSSSYQWWKRIVVSRQ